MHGLENWQARQLRITLFTNAAVPLAEAGLESVFSVEPETRVQLKNEASNIEIGSFGTGKIQFRSSPNRLDWIWEGEQVDQSFASLGSAHEVLDIMTGRLINFFSGTNHSFSRMALGGAWGIPSKDRLESYRILQEFLPNVTIDGDNSSEFLYQINRWKIHELSGEKIKINRISKWSARVALLGAQLQAQPNLAGQVIFSTSSGIEIHEAGCELDLSTPADLPRPISREECITLLESLKEMTLEILEIGDGIKN
ncbi:hypothetical protein SAMN05428989_3395 [Pseudoxanthomonas sp. GM95]|uniref:hypothetical protein n=1 Tax=Pseudoxanthomonas sp. GM95 TaxID=1881043 RepID=UPI0008BFC14E|nr:hypothetical protein [Pseudoxanthomonas sp. GM95]SEM21788.1 hypothetical protein SAMN05428989_3395 [Pseudoxanthomonas sp. GM95]